MLNLLQHLLYPNWAIAGQARNDDSLFTIGSLFLTLESLFLALCSSLLIS